MAALRLIRLYDATPAEVWAALTEAESLPRWLASTERLELEPGGAVELRFNPTRIDARVREIEPGRVLELDWPYPGEQPSVVRFELAAEGDGTVLVLHHRELEGRLGEAYGAGWTRHLERLERLL
jgi:uncharacterized protein YndB with AHSA1/START domain